MEKRQVAGPVSRARRSRSYVELTARAALELSVKLAIEGLPRISRQMLAMSTFDVMWLLGAAAHRLRWQVHSVTDLSLQVVHRPAHPPDVVPRHQAPRT